MLKGFSLVPGTFNKSWVLKMTIKIIMIILAKYEQDKHTQAGTVDLTEQCWF